MDIEINVFKNIIAGEELDCVSLRDVYVASGLKKDFSSWVKEKIKTYKFEENVDFVKKNHKTVYDRIDKIDYLATLDMAMCLAMTTKKHKGLSVYKYLSKHKGYFVAIRTPHREEFVFGEQIIKNLFNGYEIIPQLPVENGRYRIDWYIPELKLAIEFDEEHHSSQKISDKERQEEIEAVLGCRFLRYKKTNHYYE